MAEISKESEGIAAYWLTSERASDAPPLTAEEMRTQIKEANTLTPNASLDAILQDFRILVLVRHQMLTIAEAAAYTEQERQSISTLSNCIEADSISFEQAKAVPLETAKAIEPGNSYIGDLLEEKCITLKEAMETTERERQFFRGHSVIGLTLTNLVIGGDIDFSAARRLANNSSFVQLAKHELFNQAVISDSSIITTLSAMAPDALQILAFAILSDRTFKANAGYWQPKDKKRLADMIHGVSRQMEAPSGTTLDTIDNKSPPLGIEKEVEAVSKIDPKPRGRASEIGDLLARFGVTEKPHSHETPPAPSHTPAPTTTFHNSFIASIWDIHVEQNGNLTITTNIPATAKELAKHLHQNSPDFQFQVEDNMVRVGHIASSLVLQHLSGDNAGKFSISQKCANGALKAFNDTQAPPDRSI
jgi:hypothetical protein